jgi:hypothetical protein
LGLRPGVIFAVRTFKIVQIRGDSLTTNGRELTRRNGLISRPLASIRGCFSSLLLRLRRAVSIGTISAPYCTLVQ